MSEQPPGSPRFFDRLKRTNAFSLVEIVLAIGIVSFAFVAIFGLLPVGMNTFRQAIDTSVTSQIVQRIVNEAQQTDFPTLIATLGTTPLPRYFDDQGNEVTAKPDSSIYTVLVTGTAQTTLPNSTPPSPSLATIIVQIANNPGNNNKSPFDPAKNRLPISTYSALISKNQ